MKKENTAKRRIGVMDIILVFIAVTLIVFSVVMIRTFWLYGAIPDTLCTCVFTVLGTECGAMAWIKTTKERYKEREYQKEDRAYDENRRNGGKTMDDKKVQDTAEEIKEFPQQDTFNGEDMTAVDDEEVE